MSSCQSIMGRETLINSKIKCLFRVLLGILILGNSFVFATELAPVGEHQCHSVDVIIGQQENEKRNYIRYEIKDLKKPVVIDKTGTDIQSLINISRGGVAIKTMYPLAIGQIVPIKLVYEDIVINTEAKIVFVQGSIAGAEFTNNDEQTINNLLYLSIRLDNDNGNLVTKLSS